jgi:hypothetical protein
MLSRGAELLQEGGRLDMGARLGLQKSRLVAGHRKIDRREAGSRWDIQLRAVRY